MGYLFAFLLGTWFGLILRKDRAPRPKPLPNYPGEVVGTAQEDLRAGDFVAWDPANGRIHRCR